MKILLTAFDPFGGERVNAAMTAVAALPEQVGDWQVHKQIVPTVFAAAGDVVTAALAKLRQDAVFCIGQAAGRGAVTPERVAINCMDARIADNTGFQPDEQPVIAGAPAAYFSTLPVKALTAAIREAGIPSEVSNSAGTFVCNALYYRVLHFAAQEQPRLGACFLHVPAMPEQVADGAPCMTTEQTVRAIEAAILAIPQHMEY